jgi:transposase
VLRARIILKAASDLRNEHIAQRLGTSRRAVKLWRKRWSQAKEALTEAERKDDEKELRKLVRRVLSDAPRSGAPPKFTAEQVCQIILWPVSPRSLRTGPQPIGF